MDGIMCDVSTHLTTQCARCVLLALRLLPHAQWLRASMRSAPVKGKPRRVACRKLSKRRGAPAAL